MPAEHSLVKTSYSIDLEGTFAWIITVQLHVHYTPMRKQFHTQKFPVTKLEHNTYTYKYLMYTNVATKGKQQGHVDNVVKG